MFLKFNVCRVHMVITYLLLNFLNCKDAFIIQLVEDLNQHFNKFKQADNHLPPIDPSLLEEERLERFTGFSMNLGDDCIDNFEDIGSHEPVDDLDGENNNGEMEISENQDEVEFDRDY